MSRVVISFTNRHRTGEEALTRLSSMRHSNYGAGAEPARVWGGKKGFIFLMWGEGVPSKSSTTPDLWRGGTMRIPWGTGVGWGRSCWEGWKPGSRVPGEEGSQVGTPQSHHA